MNKKSLLIIAVSVLVIALIGITYLLFTEKQSNRELIEEFALEKEDLENEYTRFAQQYDELKLTVSNDSLSILLEQEQIKTQRLLEELRTVKISNATEIRRLKKRTGFTPQNHDRLYQPNRLPQQAYQPAKAGNCGSNTEIQCCFTPNQQPVRREKESE